MSSEKVCRICNKNFELLRSLSTHIQKLHSKVQEYYDLYLKKDDEGFCEVCKKATNFDCMERGYFKYHGKCVQKSEFHKNLVKEAKIKKYGTPAYNNPLKSKRTNLERYGVDNAMKRREIREKSKQTFLEKYGVKNASQVEEFKKKRENTNLERYGVKHAMSNPDIMERCLNTWEKNYEEGHPGRESKIKEKKKETCIQKYGVENPSQVEEFKERRENTNLERYGVKHAMSNPEVRKKSEEKVFEKYGYKSPLLIPEVIEKRTGPNNYRWIEDREQRFAPYTEKFFNIDFRSQIKQEQNNIDPITEELLTDEAHLHHIDYNKQNDSRENLIWLNHSTHAKTNSNRDEWKLLLQKINKEIINKLPC